MSTVNLSSYGWKPPSKVYALGFLRELEFKDGTCMIIKGNSIFLGADASGSQMYFFRQDRKVGTIGIIELDGLDELMKSYREFNWGNEPTKVIRMSHFIPPAGEVYPKAACVRIDYKSSKGKKIAEYTHKHKAPYPILAFDKSGVQPFYVGGKYKVREAGIID